MIKEAYLDLTHLVKPSTANLDMDTEVTVIQTRQAVSISGFITDSYQSLSYALRLSMPVS